MPAFLLPFQRCLCGLLATLLWIWHVFSYWGCTAIKIITDCHLERPSLHAKQPQAWQKLTRRVDRGRKRKWGEKEGPAITVTVSNINSISCDSNDLFLLYLPNGGWHVKQTMPVAISAGHGSVYLSYHYSANDYILLPQHLQRPVRRNLVLFFSLPLPLTLFLIIMA